MDVSDRKKDLLASELDYDKYLVDTGRRIWATRKIQRCYRRYSKLNKPIINTRGSFCERCRILTRSMIAKYHSTSELTSLDTHFILRVIAMIRSARITLNELELEQAI